MPYDIRDTSRPIRQGIYGEAVGVPLSLGIHAIDDEQNYYNAVNPTFGTGIAYALVTTFTSGSAVVVVRNPETTRIATHLDYLRLIVAVAPASATQGHYALAVDTINRNPNDSQTWLTNYQPSSDAVDRSFSAVFVGAIMTATAGSLVRYIDRGVLRAQIPVVGDEYLFTFGRMVDIGPQTPGAAGAARFVIPNGPVVLGPNNYHSMALHLWFPGNAVTPASFEVEAGFWER